MTAMFLGFSTDRVLRAFIFVGLVSAGIFAQSSDRPIIVQPGAPGQASVRLPDTTTAKLLATSRKDVEFMQGMIHHHAQAVEMVDLIESRTKNKDIRLLGTRIRQSQADEIAFMSRWLDLRGETVAYSNAAKPSEHTHGKADTTRQMLMPGMLTPEQMSALRQAKGADFDRLFLEGMIQHHRGALVMVKELFDTAGAGQDAELFNFASDVDSGQRAEIKTMETILARIP